MGGYRNIPYIDYGCGYTNVYTYQNSLTYISLKWMHFIVYKLHLNKLVLKIKIICILNSDSALVSYVTLDKSLNLPNASLFPSVKWG